MENHMGLLKWITHTTEEDSDSKSPTFQFAWMCLHLFAALNCLAIVLHILSAKYHAERIAAKNRAPVALPPSDTR